MAFTDENADTWATWSYGGRIKVSYQPRLSGLGELEADWYVDFLKRRYAGRTFKRAYEWCSGPGFIGFALLEAGICESLCLADVNPAAVEVIQRTIAENDLASKVSVYLSDNLNDIPKHERFDLVVGNPPYGYAPIHMGYVPPSFLERAIREGTVAPSRSWDDLMAARNQMNASVALRIVDPEWRLHADFYSNIKAFLLPGAQLCISEWSPLETEVVWDIRPRTPILDFKAQIQKGGLKLVGLECAGGEAPDSFRVRQDPQLPPVGSDWFWIVISENLG